MAAGPRGAGSQVANSRPPPEGGRKAGARPPRPVEVRARPASRPHAGASRATRHTTPTKVSHCNFPRARREPEEEAPGGHHRTVAGCVVEGGGVVLGTGRWLK